MASRSSKHRRPIVVAAVWFLIALMILVMGQGFLIEPDSLVVQEYRLDLPSWPVALNDFKIAAIGDIHAGSPYVDEAKLGEIVKRISAARPDLIVWLGDYVIQGVVGGRFIEPERVAAIISKAEARYGQVAVMGNHDRWLGTDRVERAFESEGISFLRWQSKTLHIGNVNLHFYGLDDFELSPKYWPKLKAARAEWRTVPAEEPIVVLSHSPDVFASLTTRVTLTLAAHTHGGQVRLPFIGSPIVPSSFGQRFARGHIVEDGKHLFVNTGIGTSIIPVRLGVPPEISILILRAEAPH